MEFFSEYYIISIAIIGIFIVKHVLRSITLSIAKHQAYEACSVLKNAGPNGVVTCSQPSYSYASKPCTKQQSKRRRTHRQRQGLYLQYSPRQNRAGSQISHGAIQSPSLYEAADNQKRGRSNMQLQRPKRITSRIV